MSVMCVVLKHTQQNRKKAMQDLTCINDTRHKHDDDKIRLQPPGPDMFCYISKTVFIWHKKKQLVCNDDHPAHSRWTVLP